MVIFDFDGTLADSISLSIRLFNSYSQKFHYSTIDRKENQDLSAMELVKLAHIKFWKLPGLVCFFRKQLAQKSAQIEIFPGVKEMLLELKNAGHDLGIITSNSSEGVKNFLQRNRLKECFSYIKTDVSLFGKTKSLCKAKKLLRKNFVYVGDELRDIEACRKSGTPIVSVSWGFNSFDSLQKENPGRVAKNAQEAFAMILTELENLPQVN